MKQSTSTQQFWRRAILVASTVVLANLAYAGRNTLYAEQANCPNPPPSCTQQSGCSNIAGYPNCSLCFLDDIFKTKPCIAGS